MTDEEIDEFRTQLRRTLIEESIHLEQVIGKLRAKRGAASTQAERALWNAQIDEASVAYLEIEMVLATYLPLTAG
jgi:hypothetical protein